VDADRKQSEASSGSNYVRNMVSVKMATSRTLRQKVVIARTSSSTNPTIHATSLEPFSSTWNLEYVCISSVPESRTDRQMERMDELLISGIGD